MSARAWELKMGQADVQRLVKDRPGGWIDLLTEDLFSHAGETDVFRQREVYVQELLTADKEALLAFKRGVHWQRTHRHLQGREVDRVPMLGGWLMNARHLADLAGITVDEYLAGPERGAARAYAALGVDCVICRAAIPDQVDSVRGVSVLDEDFKDVMPEDLKRDAEAMPDTEQEVLAQFDAKFIEDAFRFRIEKWTDLMGELQIIPTFWESVPQFQLWGEYGYEAYLMAVALYPDAVGKIYWKTGVEGRERSRIYAKLIREYGLLPLVFEGYDVCDQRSPMCSAAFLRQYYFPWVRYALEPYREAGIDVVRHCDGNVASLIDDFIDAGYTGLQGFQFECGVDLHAIVKRFKERTGKDPVIFSGMSVTRTLPFGTVDDVRAEIEYVLDATNGGRRLVFFSSNTVGIEVPLASIAFAHEYISSGRYTRGWCGVKHRQWPWSAKKDVSP